MTFRRHAAIGPAIPTDGGGRAAPRRYGAAMANSTTDPNATTADPPRRGATRTALATLLPFLWPRGDGGMRARVVVAIVCLVLAKLSAIFIPIFYGDAVDALAPAAGVALAIPLGLILAYALARVLSLAFAELRDTVFARVGQRAIRKVGIRVFGHLHGLSLRFHLDRQTGGLSRVIERGTKAIETLLSFALFNFVPTFIEILLVTVVLWALFDWRFAALTFVVLIGYVAYTMLVTEWRLKYRRRMNDSDQQAHTKAIDSLLNFETVKYFGNEAHERARFDEALAVYETAAVDNRMSMAVLNIGQALIISIGLAAIMYLAATGIVDGSMTIGDFVLVNTYMMQLYQPLNFFGFVYREIKRCLVDMETMFRLLGEPQDVQDAPDAPDLHCPRGHLVFRDVRFGYDPRRPILDGIDFEVPPGRTVAIVGPTGAGKSTIGRLLFRFYDVTGGSIALDGQDLRSVSQHSLRRAIGVVPQDTVLFNDTVYYNIAYGRPSASPAEVEEAARLARIHDFVMGLPDGYQTLVGERGLKLSGGEKQRVAIARTILKRPAILLFDEATSALDTTTERDIQANLRDVSRDRTTLVIAHRLSTVVDADEILVLKAGRVAERGRHADLLAADGIYAQLWTQQHARNGAGPAEPGVALDKLPGPAPAP